MTACEHCLHPLSEHTNSLKCRVCKSDCGIDCWTPGLIIDNLRAGLVLPEDWRARLERAGFTPPAPNLFDTYPSRRTEEVETGGRL